MQTISQKPGRVIYNWKHPIVWATVKYLVMIVYLKLDLLGFYNPIGSVISLPTVFFNC